MLEQRSIPYHYREYRTDPLSESELRTLLKRLGLRPRDVIRTRDRAFTKLDLTGDEADDRLIALMAAHPTLLQRPIGVMGDRAVVGRPPESLLQLV